MREILIDPRSEEFDLPRLQQLPQHHGAVGLEGIDVRLRYAKLLAVHYRHSSPWADDPLPTSTETGASMIYFLALLPATALTIAGYFVLYLAGRSEGALRTFGKYLGFWAFTLAGLLILGAVFAAAHGGHHCPVFGMHGMHERMHDPTAAPTPPPPAPR